MPITDEQIQELWHKYYPIIKGRIISKIQDPIIAEDIASDVFLGLVNLVKKKKLRDETKIKTILFTITSRKIYDWLRNKYKNKLLVPAFSFYEKTRGNNTVIIDYEAKEFYNQVMVSASSLTDRQKQVFMLMVLDGASRSEAAEKLHVSESRIQHLIARAKEKIADDLAQIYFPEPDNGRNELVLWVEKFFSAYLRLALKTGKLTDGIKESAQDALKKIKEKLET